MYNIKRGQGCGVKATLLSPAGAVCDLRKARYVAATLVQPNGMTMICEDCSVDTVTNAVYVKLLGERELRAIGKYGLIFNVKLGDDTMYATPVVNFAEVVVDADEGYLELTLALSVVVVDFPANVAYTGASPKISSRYTWLVFNDKKQAYIDTGIKVTPSEGPVPQDNSAEFYHLQAKVKCGCFYFHREDLAADGKSVSYPDMKPIGLAVEVLSQCSIVHLMSDDYRLVFMRETSRACKTIGGIEVARSTGSRMRAPMLATADASADKLGRPISSTFQRIAMTDITRGNIIEITNAKAFCDNFMPVKVDLSDVEARGSFRGISDHRSGRRFGVAIYKRCDEFGHKWKRVSDIVWWKIHLNGTRLWHILPNYEEFLVPIHTPI